MKIERQEKSVRLIPETDFEKECLKKLYGNGIEKMQFQDSWEQTGYLQIDFKVHPWDQ